MEDILPSLSEWQTQGEEIALATVVRVQRSAPRPPGARLVVTRSGRMAGSVSGGCVESDVVERALLVLDSAAGPYLANYGIADEVGFQVGLSCGGSIDVLIEPFAPDRGVERLDPIGGWPRSPPYMPSAWPRRRCSARKLTLHAASGPYWGQLHRS